MKIQILHNPRCSKSREAMKLLEERGVTFEIVDYLNGSLSKKFLKDVFKALKLRPREVLRTKEESFKSLSLDLDNNEAVIEAILNHPIILERPIIIIGNKAVIGRPLENVLTIL